MNATAPGAPDAPSVNSRVVTGLAWMVGARLFVRVVGFVSTLILARILVPADFGVVAVASSMVALLELLTTFSFDTALIQRSDLARRHLDTVWTLTLLFAIFVGAALCVSAAPVATFYRDPRLREVMVVIGVLQIIAGFANVGTVYFRRDLDFRRDFLLQVSSKVAGFVVAIPLAFILRSYWALIAGTAASTLATVVVSYLMHGYRPKFSLEAARDMFGFSAWLMLNNVLGFLRVRAVDLIVGRGMGTKGVGLFNMANDIAGLTASETMAAINRVSYPAYVKMANQPQTLELAFTNVLGFTALMVLPLSIGIAAIADLAVPVLLGNKWLSAEPLIVSLGLYNGVNCLQTNTGQILTALGKPYMISRIAIIHVSAVLPALMIAASFHQLNYVAWVFLIYTLIVGLPATYWIVIRHTPVRLRAVLAVTWRPLLAAAAMYGGLRAMIAGNLLPGDWPELAKLAIAVVGGAAIFAAAVAALWALSGRPLAAERHLLDWIRRRGALV